MVGDLNNMDNLGIKILTLRTKIEEWDVLAKDNPNNVHNLSTSERTDWQEELDALRDKWANQLLDNAF